MNKMSDIISYNKECPICIEDYYHNNSVHLACHHTFHSECLLKYIETVFKKKNKLDICKLCCKELRCPLCRQSIPCADSNSLIYNQYKMYKQEYKTLKKEIYNLQNQSYMLTFKFKCNKLFRKISTKDVYNYMIEDETILETIMKKKQLCNNAEEMMLLYKQIYYEKCMYCVI